MRVVPGEDLDGWAHAFETEVRRLETQMKSVRPEAAIHLERFFGVLIEHYAGAFPVWLSPMQVALIPIADRHIENHAPEQLGQI